ncbi:ParM/StbA family protein [Paenibacillus planticolens]|uniref:Actin-like protein N-terminal domain-containing protein n=1 Tax=Paenibacillus planticolens TaxID=2654976 RepID=A0ABX1ZMK7_9BACL|nr:ParM/StbA family protein [Paenibacillus planticolens]NOV01319.1 hypothetical protein [Paenibacillus planticolens]
MIVAIDAGNYETKYFDGVQLKKFPSDIGFDWRERRLEQLHGDFDFEWEYQGKRGFAGTLAKYESQCAESMKGDSKAHFDALLRILLAIHQFRRDSDVSVVVGQPINTHTNAEKKLIKEMLTGRHDLTVNGIQRSILIRRCEVAAEGVSAGVLLPKNGVIRILDIGSGTINYGTLKDMRKVDRDSFSSTEGLETFRNAHPEAIARMIALRAMTKWSKHDLVRVCGGGADALFRYLKEYFPCAELMQDSVFANVRAFYEIGRKLYSGG